MTDPNDARARAARSGSRMMHGGYVDAPPPSAEMRNMVDALTDTIVPPEEGWPSAAELGIADLLVTYLVPPGAPVSLYPHFARADFEALLDRVARPLVGADLDTRVLSLRELERTEPELFARLRDFVYYAYYGHPNVVRQIRSSTRYGADYLGGSQPHGYRDVLEGWGQRRMSTRGAYFRTESVLRLRRATKERA